MGPRKNPIVWEFLRDISLFNAAIFFSPTKSLVNGAMKKGLLVVCWVYRGWNTSQLCRDYFINHDIRIPSLNNQYPGVPNTSWEGVSFRYVFWGPVIPSFSVFGSLGAFTYNGTASSRRLQAFCTGEKGKSKESGKDRGFWGKPFSTWEDGFPWRTDQWLFLVPVIGGRYHRIPQLAVYTIYIPLIYCQLGDYMVPTTY